MFYSKKFNSRFYNTRIVIVIVLLMIWLISILTFLIHIKLLSIDFFLSKYALRITITKLEHFVIINH